jgi:hypothetical protein
MILAGFIAFVLLAWLAKLQRDHMREGQDRTQRQRRQRVGREPIPGAQTDLDDEEQRLLAILRERKARDES